MDINGVIKNMAAAGVASMSSKYTYSNSIFLLSHMRAGTSALSNVLCSHEKITGYGETHVTYSRSYSVGSLVVNQYRRGALDGTADYYFDKILHNRYDSDLPKQFFNSKCIFMVREPFATIQSIRKLFIAQGSCEYGTDEDAASYYIDRVSRLIRIWLSFPSDTKYGLTTEALMYKPNEKIKEISDFLYIKPNLVNQYVISKASLMPGAGDPLDCASYNSIESRSEKVVSEQELSISEDTVNRVKAVYVKAKELIG